MRTFIAANFPEAAKAELGKVITSLRSSAPRAKWVHPGNIHLTLKFLGEVAEDILPQLAVAVGEVAANAAPAELQLEGFGVFPQKDRARVFWVAITAGASWLKSLAGDIDEATAKLGFPKEKRRFSAHVTLARFREPQNTTQLLARSESVSYRSGPIPVGSIEIMKSVLSSSGPTYSVYQARRLAGR